MGRGRGEKRRNRLVFVEVVDEIILVMIVVVVAAAAVVVVVVVLLLSLFLPYPAIKSGIP